MNKDSRDFAGGATTDYEPWHPELERYPLAKMPKLAPVEQKTREALYRQSKKQPPRDYGFARDRDIAKYYSAEAMQREWKGLWTKTWLLVGNANDVPTPNSFMKVDIGKESILIVRGEDGSLRAMYNVCQHRGTRLVTQDFGRSKKFICPFHHWEFGNDGSCLKVAKAETFRKETLANDFSLPRVKVDTWNGLVFINLNPDAEPLLEFLPAEFRDMLEAYDLARWIRVVDVEQEWPVNWKTALESFIEGYHVEAIHPQMNPYFDSYYVQQDLYDNGFARSIFPFMSPMPTHPSYNKAGLSDEHKVFMRDAGLTESEFPERSVDVRAAIVEAKRRNQDRLGMDYARFTDEQLVDDWNIGVFPSATFNIHPEGMLFQRWWPHAHDPRKMVYYYQVYAMPGVKEMPTYMGVPKDADTSGTKVLPRTHSATGDLEVLGSVLSQDATFLPRLQAGLESDGFRGSVFSEQELRIRQFHAEYHKRLDAVKD